MHREKQHMLALTQSEQPRAHQGSRGEIERCIGVSLCAEVEGHVWRRGIEERQVFGGERKLHRRQDDLHEIVALEGKGGAEGFVTLDDEIERLLKRLDVQVTGESERERDRVRPCFALDLIEHPEALLREGHRHHLHFAVLCRQRRDRWRAHVAGSFAARRNLSRETGTSAISSSSSGAARRAASTSAANCATESPRRSESRGTVTPNSPRTRPRMRIARSECPPSSRKPSAVPTRSIRSTSAHSAATKACVSVCGATNCRSDPCHAGGRNALRSALPLGVRGSTSRRTNVDGIM